MTVKWGKDTRGKETESTHEKLFIIVYWVQSLKVRLYSPGI